MQELAFGPAKKDSHLVWSEALPSAPINSRPKTKLAGGLIAVSTRSVPCSVRTSRWRLTLQIQRPLQAGGQTLPQVNNVLIEQVIHASQIKWKVFATSADQDGRSVQGMRKPHFIADVRIRSCSVSDDSVV